MATNWAALVPLVTAGVTAAGQVAQARQQGRQAQAQAQVPVDALNQRSYETGLDARTAGLRAQDAALLARAAGMLEEQAANRKAGGERASQSVRGDLLANLSDVSLSGLPSRIPKMSFEGGLRPSLLSDNSRKLGAELSRAALVDQLKGDATPFADLPAADFSSVINAGGGPGATPLPDESRLDKVLGAIGTIGGLGASVAQAYKPGPGNAVPSAPGVSPITAMPGQPVAMPGPPPPPQPMLAGRNPLGSNVTTGYRGA